MEVKDVVDKRNDLLEEKLLEMPIIRNKRWLKFAEVYAETMDHKYSYKVAYPNASEGTLLTAGYKLLQVPEVKAYVNYILLNNLRNVKLSIEPSKILKEIESMAYSPDHKYPGAKKDALKMLADLYNGELLDMFKMEHAQQAKRTLDSITEYEEEKKKDEESKKTKKKQ